MARGRRQQTRIRRRIFVVTGLILLAVVLAGALFALYAASLTRQADLVLLTADEGSGRTAVLGSGVSLDQAEPANLIRDASFEPLVFNQALTIYSGDATTLTVSSEEASAGQYGDGFFDGASARVMSQTSAGLSLKKSARVLHYGINRVGVFQTVRFPGDKPQGLAILAFGHSGEMSLAVGEQGLIIRNVTGQMPEIIESGLDADLTGICATGQGFLACSNRGDLLFSSNGQDWQTWKSALELPLQAIAASEDGLYAAVGLGGALITGQTGTAHPIMTQTRADLIDIAYGSSTFVAVGLRGTILISRNGMLWQQVSLADSADWQSVDYRDGRFVLAGSAGATAISDNGADFQLLAHNGPTSSIDLVMLSRQQLIALDEAGKFYVSSDSGISWLQSVIDTGMQSRVIALAGKDKILSADANGSLGLAQLVAEIQLDSPLKEGQYQAGDLIYLEKITASIPVSYLASDTSQPAFQDPWQLFGTGTRQRVTDEVSPGGGLGSLLLRNQPENAGQPAAAIVSQVIDTRLISQDKQNEVYRIELWMKQSDLADRTVQAWLTGPFRTVGTTFANVGANWKKYSYTFILPARTGNLENHEVRLNFAINGGSLWLDQVSLCKAADRADLLSGSFQSELGQIKPQFIRLGFVPIGIPSVRQEGWASSLSNENPFLSSQGWTSQTGGSLHAALTLALNSGADPWLVIDSYASEATVLNLIEYLTGPISEPYGKIRQDLGEVIPWTERLGRILIEFADSGGILKSDRYRADFVDLMIRTVSQSPYYRQIKGKLIFIDGMAYSDGVMLSTADYHASDLNGLILPDRAQALQQVFLDYYDRIPRNPEKPTQNWPELIRTARLRPNGANLPNLADLTEILLRDLGRQSSLGNLYLPVRSSQDWHQTWPIAAEIAAAGARGVPLTITGATPALRAYGFKSGSRIAIVLTNLSDKPATCQLIADLPIQRARLYKYDAKGSLLNQQVLRRNTSRLTVLPGGVVLIIKEADPEQ